MERLLFSEEMDKIENIFHEAFDFNNNVVYFPIRHHSPACSYHLKKTIDEYNPDIILIEGPSNAGELIEHIVHEDTKMPISIYYSYADTKGLLGDENGKYMCYYPFLDYSPEYLALKEGKKKEIPAKFIDLPYEQILFNSSNGEGVREENKKKSYNDDYLFERSKYIKALCKKENCRNFNELWEKLFEVDGLKSSTEDFVKSMVAHCYLSRVDCSEESLEQEGCIAREKYMTMEINKYSKEYNKILVVTGGFHTWGLLKIKKEKPTLKLKRIKKADSGAYLMPYSFEECDQLNGYASGMPYTAFYNKVWQNIEKKSPKAFEASVLHFITKCGRELRRKEEVSSTADSIEALNMAKGLAALRDKYECGAYELKDGVRSAFVKGELSVSNNSPLEVLDKLMIGNKIGALSSTADVPPIVSDFREKCKKYKLNLKTSQTKEKILQIYTTKSHREISRLFHMMTFLQTDFCVKEKGPDFVRNINTNLIREIWKYRWSPAVESKLIENSVYGGTLEEAVREIIFKRMKDLNNHSSEAASLLVHSALMGINELVDKLLSLMKDIIQSDGEFYSLCNACSKLYMLCKQKYLMNLDDLKGIDHILKEGYYKATSLISNLYNITKEEENEVIQKIKELYNLSLDNEMDFDNTVYIEQLRVLLNNKECNAALEGAALGIMISLGEVDKEDVIERAKSYFYAVGEKNLEAAVFLKGLFATSRDLMMGSDILTKEIDNMIKSLNHEEFMQILPEMRLAFSFFIPSEMNSIAERVGKFYEKSKDDIINRNIIEEEEIIKAKELNKEAVEELKLLGIL